MSMCVFACLGRDSGPLYIQKGKARKTQYAMPSAQMSTAPAINAQDGLPQSLSNLDSKLPQNTESVNTQGIQAARNMHGSH